LSFACGGGGGGGGGSSSSACIVPYQFFAVSVSMMRVFAGLTNVQF
jgi:hypothetical protein